MEVERDHVLGRKVTDEGDIFAAEDDLLAAGQRRARPPPASWRCPSRRWAREARFDRVLFDGGEFGHAGEVHVGSEEEMDFLGIPGLLEPDQMRELLQQPAERAGPQAEGRAAGRTEPDTVAEVSTHEQLAILRRELNGLVAAWHHRTGQAHGITHAALRKECGGPAAAVATADQLHARIDRIREWATRKSS